MSWLFSQALVAEYSADICSDGEPSAPSSGSPTQQAYCAPDKTTAFSRLSRFWMTFKPLTEDLGAILLTSYLADFRARTFQPPEKARESKEKPAACGSTWPELSVKYCLDTSSWKTHHSLWEEDLPWSSVILPRWGMTRNGHVLQHPTSERPISATGSGLWPTPLATDGSNGGPNQRGGKGDMRLSSAVALWPTPRSNDAEKRGNFDLDNPRNGLAAAAKRFPTPTKSDYKGSGPQMLRSDGKIRGDRLDYATERNQDGSPVGGQLNPTWVEWLMGWPLGWTDLRPLETDRFREWQQQHGGY